MSKKSKSVIRQGFRFIQQTTTYLTTDMAKQVDSSRPYTNLKSYLEYKQRGSDALKLREDEIINLSSDYQEITVNEESV